MTEVVYFIDDGTAVKIGWTKDLPGRLATLQTGSSRPLTLLRAVPGGRDLEASLHERLADARLQGEWFRRGAVRQMLDRVDGNWRWRELQKIARETERYKARIGEVEAEIERLRRQAAESEARLVEGAYANARARA